MRQVSRNFFFSSGFAVPVGTLFILVLGTIFSGSVDAKEPANTAPTSTPSATASPTATPSASAETPALPPPPVPPSGTTNAATPASPDPAVVALEKEKASLELQIALIAKRAELERAELAVQIEKLAQQADLLAKEKALAEAKRESALQAELASEKSRLEKLETANKIAEAEFASEKAALQKKADMLDVRIKELQAESTEFQNKVAMLTAEIDLREKRDQWKNRVDAEIAYPAEPFKDGVLRISDRRIPLNGVVTMNLADEVVDRIDYFNNQNREHPIFIVIDRSPGGSVMAGYKILKAMEGSAAPVYVVVKSYAASMAAGITTLAKRSYAYPNAVLLHHQVLTFSFGNLTEQRENLRDLEEWWKRLATPIAAKMGIGLDEFIERMYKNRSTGDWEVFGDDAKKLKWVDEIVTTIQEDGVIKNPDGDKDRAKKMGWDEDLREQTDGEGRRFALLPRLDPVDVYYLHNPDGYYRQP